MSNLSSLVIVLLSENSSSGFGDCAQDNMKEIVI